MGEIVNSISFQQNTLCWVQVELNAGQSITIQRVVESPLPFVINYDNVQKPTTAVRIANHLNSLIDRNDLGSQHVRFLLSARLGLVRKVLVDHYLPQEMYADMVHTELDSVFTSPLEEFHIYQPDYARRKQSLRELLTVSIRKDVLTYMQQAGKANNFGISHIGLNCFTIDELYRRFFPNLIGQSLLINFAENGFEVIISDEETFLDYFYRPYSKSLQTIEQVTLQDVAATFSELLGEIQQAGPNGMPIYSPAQAFLFGSAFREDMMETLQAQSNVPLRILNPAETTEWQIISNDPTFDSANAFRFVEPLSHIF